MRFLFQVHKPGSIDILGNTFIGNKGEWSLHVSASETDTFNGSIQQNYFTANRNSRGSLIVGSPLFKVNGNEFENKLEQFDLEVEYAQKDVSTIHFFHLLSYQLSMLSYQLLTAF